MASWNLSKERLFRDILYNEPTLTVIWLHGNKLQWNLYKNSNVFLQQNTNFKMSPSKQLPLSSILNVLKLINSLILILFMSPNNVMGKKYDEWISLMISKQGTTMSILVPRKAHTTCRSSGNLEKWLMLCKRKSISTKGTKVMNSTQHGSYCCIQRAHGSNFKIRL